MSNSVFTISALDSLRLNTLRNDYRSMILKTLILPLFSALNSYVSKVTFEQAVSQHKDIWFIFTVSISTVSFVDNEFVFISNCNDVRGFFSNCFRVLYSLSLPQVLLVAEELYRNIKVYFKDSCQNMIFDNQKTLLNSNSAKLHNDLCNKFDSYCFTTTIVKGKKLHVKFDHVFFKASVLVEQILRAKHSWTLVCFMEVFIHFIQIELFEIAFILREFIKKIFEKVIRKERSWNQICRLLEKFDLEPLDLTMTKIWKCTTDTFESKFGAFNQLVVSIRLNYIKCVYESKKYFEKE